MSFTPVSRSMPRSAFAAALCATLALTACSEDTLHSDADPALPANPSVPGVPGGDPPGGVVPPATCQTGGVMGRLCLPAGEDVLADAHLTVTALDCLGLPVTFTDDTAANGHFALAGLPAGTHTVSVEHPSWSGTFEITVVPGEIVFAGLGGSDDAPLCESPGAPRLAVVRGEYDQVQVLLEGLGLTYDLYEHGGNPSPAHAFLMNLEKMREYDVIFFNCGRNERDFMHSHITYSNPADPLTRRIEFDFEHQTYQNLRDFVMHGGNVYASDWAWPIAEALNPTVIDFHGDETNASNVNVGSERDIVADLTDEGLQLFMASADIAIDFNLQGYAIIDATTGQVYARGDVPIFATGGSGTTLLEDRPLLVGFRPFSAGGVVLYTTFHYHAQPSAQMMQLLRYLIFQL
jgi:hypothetical protein